MHIQDPNFSIPDPGSDFEFKYFKQKIFYKLSEI
jgi:hypothetical protein